MLKVHQNSATKAMTGVKTSVSIAFYNNIDFLKLTLSGFLRQSISEFEILISDDGSKPEVVSAVHAWIESLPIGITHLWHEDLGFRKNRMLNQAIQKAKSDYLIFVDQDCVPHSHFVEEHLKARKPGYALSGRRMELTPWQSRLLTPKKIQAGFLEKNFWWLGPTGAYMRDAHSSKGLHLPEGKLRNFLQTRKAKGLVGCNFSAWKKDLLAVNGFDTRYEAPGIGEDSDIDFRLQLQGIKIKSVEFAAVQYHVFHPLTEKPSRNEELFAAVQALRQAATHFGIKELENR